MTSLIHIVSFSKLETVQWSVEPGYDVWNLQVDNGTLLIEIMKQKSGHLLASFFSDKNLAVHRCYKGLRDLEQQHIWQSESVGDHWQWEFPSKGLSLLKEKLKFAQPVT